MNTIHGYNEVHITYDLTKMLRSIKRCEKREEEENELRSRINEIGRASCRERV